MPGLPSTMSCISLDTERKVLYMRCFSSIVKVLNFGTPKCFAVITLEFNKRGFSRGADGMANIVDIGFNSELTKHISLEGSNMIFHSLTFAWSRGKG